MHSSIIQRLKSPETGHSLELDVIEAYGDEVINGRLLDAQTGAWFRIEDGIADLAPLLIRSDSRYNEFATKYGFDPSVGTEEDSDSPENDLEAYTTQIDFFRDYHEQYETEVVGSQFYKIFDESILGVWLEKGLKAGDMVVEIGCGSGRQTLPMAQLGCRVIGMDLSEEMLRVARKKMVAAGQRADFIIASADKLPLKDEQSDAAVIFGSLHHFPDPELSVAEAARLIKQGGAFFMVEPHDSLLRPVFDFAMRVITLWEEEAADEPLFSADQWQEWFRRNRIEATISYSTVLPPHLFYLTGHKLGVELLKASDRFINLIPGVKRLGGVIVADGRKI